MIFDSARHTVLFQTYILGLPVTLPAEQQTGRKTDMHLSRAPLSCSRRLFARMPGQGGVQPPERARGARGERKRVRVRVHVRVRVRECARLQLPPDLCSKLRTHTKSARLQRHTARATAEGETGQRGAWAGGEGLGGVERT